jgi:hypothetical protein
MQFQYTYLCLLYHIDIIRTIANGKRNFVESILYGAHHYCFLLRCDATADDTLAILRDVDEELFILLFLHDFLEEMGVLVFGVCEKTSNSLS